MSSCHTAHCLLSHPPLMSGVETLTVPFTVCSPALWSSLIKWLLSLEQALFCWREAITLLGEERALWKPEGCQDTACLSQAGSFSHNDWQWHQVHSSRKLWDLVGNSGSFLKDCVAQHNEMWWCSTPCTNPDQYFQSLAVLRSEISNDFWLIMSRRVTVKVDAFIVDRLLICPSIIWFPKCPRWWKVQITMSLGCI